jgi:hypothetical protein
MLELVTDNYLEAVPVPQGGRLWRLAEWEERDGGRRRHRQGRPTATNRE